MKATPFSPLERILNRSLIPAQINQEETYKQVTVRLFHKGIVTRCLQPGSALSSRQWLVKKGQVLLSRIDARNGAIGLVPAELDYAIVTNDFWAFDVNDDLADSRFLDLYFGTRQFVEDCQRASEGTTNRVRIQPDRFLKIGVPLPSIAEQRRIVARVEELSAQIEEAHSCRDNAYSEADALLTSARRAVISECTDKIVALEDVCAAIIDNLHSNPRLSEIGVACLRSPDVGYGTLNLQRAQRTSEEEYRRRTARGEPRADDIVLVREGGGTGKCAVVQAGQRFSLGQRVMMLRPSLELILPRFFLHQLLSPLVQEDQIAPLSKGSASPHLNIGALKRFDLKLPPLSEQRRIVAYLDDLQAKVDAVKKLQQESEEELNALMPSILSKAFAGEL